MVPLIHGILSIYTTNLIKQDNQGLLGCLMVVMVTVEEDIALVTVVAIGHGTAIVGGPITEGDTTNGFW